MAAALLTATPAAAQWQGSATGKIGTIEATDAENYGFRVYIDGGAAMCTNGANWAYVNKSFSNYETVVSLITSAFLSDKSVQILSTIDTNGFCRIGWVTLRK